MNSDMGFYIIIFIPKMVVEVNQKQAVGFSYISKKNSRLIFYV